MPFCRKCGQSMPEGARFCGACGADSEGTSAAVTKQAAPTTPPSKAISARSKGREGLFVGILVAIIIIGIISNNKPSSSPSSAKTPEPVNAKQLLLERVKLEYTWTKGEFGTFMTANFTIKNPTGVAFKDVEITCKHRAPSGTEIDSNTRTIYEVVGANSTKKIRNFDMGFIHSQAATSSCGITDLVPLGQAE
jgi:hypothetical protein